MKAYEALIVLNSTIGQTKVTEQLTQLQTTITKAEGQIIEAKSLGQREIATPFNQKHTHGYYLQIQFYGNNKTLTAIRKAVTVTETILRDIVVLMDSILTQSDLNSLPALGEKAVAA